MNTFELDAGYVAHTYNRAPVEIVSGSGSLVKDSEGREYVDLGSGIAVNLFGVNDEEWKAAVTMQLNRVQHASNLYYTRPQAELARMVCERTGMKKLFFGNSGAEANECLIKAARKYAADKWGDEKRPVIVTLKGSFHGRTLATLTATGQDSFHHFFGPFPGGFRYAEPNDINSLREALSPGDVCCVLMEMVQGEGGVIALDRSYVKEAAKLAAESEALFAVDEVQTGNGRTGALYAWQLYGIQPDLFSTAKGIGGGIPMGFCAMGDKLRDTLTPGTHGSTFGGNPLACAGAVSILRRIDEALLKGVNERHDYIVKELSGAPGVKGVTGLGLMLGIETEKPAPEVLKACRDKGALVLTAKAKIRLLPALNIPMDQLQRGVTILKEALQ